MTQRSCGCSSGYVPPNINGLEEESDSALKDNRGIRGAYIKFLALTVLLTLVVVGCTPSSSPNSIQSRAEKDLPKMVTASINRRASNIPNAASYTCDKVTLTRQSGDDYTGLAHFTNGQTCNLHVTADGRSYFLDVERPS